MATKKIPALRIVPTTGRDTYRAIGRVFGRKATDIAVADLTPAKIEKLKSDPWLSVTEVQVEEIVPDDDPATGTGTGTNP